jgi:transposase-like protein
MNIVEISNKFPTELTAIEFFEKLRWKANPKCAYCNSTNISNRNKDFRYNCLNCKKTFSVTVNTNLHNTRLPLKTWLYAIALITDAKKGLSAKQLERNLGISYETAWTMYMKLRTLMAENLEKLGGITEMDETFVGGKPRWGTDMTEIKPKKREELDQRIKELKEEGIIIRKGRSKPKQPDINIKRGRGTEKIPVVGIVERDGNVIAKVMENLTYSNLKSMVKKHVEDENTVIITDNYKGYSKFNQIIEHIKIDHNRKLYSYRGVNTNSIESFWAIIKRGIIGQYHQVSLKYLPDYVTEFVFKYNNRNKDDMFETLVNKCVLPLTR